MNGRMAQSSQCTTTAGQENTQPSRFPASKRPAGLENGTKHTPLFDFLRYPSVVGNNQLWLLAVVDTPLHKNKRCKES